MATLGKQLSSDVVWWQLYGAQFVSSLALADVWEVDGCDDTYVVCDAIHGGAVITPGQPMFRSDERTPESVIAEWLS